MAGSAALSDFPENPRVAIVGSGAMGCYYGGRMAQNGADVHFLMRSDLEHVRAHGLDIRSHLGDFRLERVHAAGTTAEIGPCDLVVITLKTTANPSLDQHIPPLLHDGTLLLTLQNGLGNEEFLAERWGAERVLGGVCFTCINRIAPGTISHTSHGAVAIGEFGRPALDRTRAIAGWMQRHGIECRAADSLGEIRWRKLVWNVPFNGLAIAAGGIDTSRILADPALEHLVRGLMREVIGAAGRLGHEIPASFAQDEIDRTLEMGAYRPSSMIDYVDGREVEVEAIWGEPWRQATAAGASCGRMDFLYHIIRTLTAARR